MTPAWESDKPLSAADAPVKAGAAPQPTVTVRGATAIIPQKLITDGEVILLAIKPSLWSILLVSGRWLAGAAIAIAAAHFAQRSILSHHAAMLIVQASILAAAVRLLIGAMDWLGRVYVLTDRRIMRLKGVVHIDLFECQLSRIQQVVMSLPLAERALFCGTILFYTAGTDHADAAWQTVNHPSAVYQTILQAIERYTRQNP